MMLINANAGNVSRLWDVGVKETFHYEESQITVPSKQISSKQMSFVEKRDNQTLIECLIQNKNISMQ